MRTREEKLDLAVKTGRLVFGVGFLGGAVGCISLGHAVGFITAGMLAPIGGFLLYPLVAGALGDFFGNLFYPQGGPDLKAEFSAVRAKVANHDYDGAVRDLRAILAQNPQETPAALLLVRVLYDHLHQTDEALTVAVAQLHAATWSEDLDELATLTVDILLDQQRTADAAELLRRVIPRTMSDHAAAQFRERLENLQTRQ